MVTKKSIKIIKRDERNRLKEVKRTASSSAKTSAQQAARDVVATVSEWVTEIQQKRRTETARAIENLFPKTSQPGEA